MLSLIKLLEFKKYNVWQQLDMLHVKITFCHLSNVNLNTMVLFFFFFWLTLGTERRSSRMPTVLKQVVPGHLDVSPSNSFARGG